MKIGGIRCQSGDIELYANRRTVTVTVTNTSARVVRVSSHFPFDQVNPRLSFDRGVARGYHLHVPAGELVRWGPGETLDVALVAGREDAGGPSQS